MVRILSINEQIKGFEFKFRRHPIQEKRDHWKEFKNQLIKEIAKRTIIELAVSLAFTAAACLFVATPAGMATLLISAIAAVVINILLRCAAACCMYRISQLKHSDSENAQNKIANFYSILNLIRYFIPGVFSTMVDANTREVIFHEGGHALAAHLLIKNPRTRITLKPGEGGQTVYRLGPLTKIGEFFGRNKSKLIIAAAGPAVSVVTATIAIGVSLGIRKSNPEMSRYFKVMAADSIAQHAFYALSALWVPATQRGHDFLQLMVGGVHPVAAVIAIVAVPIIVRIGFYIYDKIKESMAEKAKAKAVGQDGFQIPHYRKFMNMAQAA